MRTELEYKITEYWHLSKGACGIGAGRWDRMQYVKKWIKELHPELVEGWSAKKLWLEIEDCTTIGI